MSNGINITVSRYQSSSGTGASITDADARRILADASTLLSTQDGQGDVACSMNFQLSGTVGTFSVGDGSIDSGTEYLAVCGTPNRVHVVNDINVCGGEATPYGIGCSDTPGDCMIVARDSSAGIEAVLWAHEYGHNRGLNDYAVTNNVMNGWIATTNRRVTQFQCDAYRTSAGEIRKDSHEHERTQDEKEETQMDIKDFVRRRYIHGIPYKQASSFPADVVPLLLDMLQDPKEEQYTANIVLTLGMIGDDRALRPLLDLFMQGSGQLSEQDFKIKKYTLLSLGYLLNKGERREGFELLRQTLDIESLYKIVSWTNPPTISEEDAKSQLTKMAIWGLALSGKPDAKEMFSPVKDAFLQMRGESTDNLLPKVVDEVNEAHSVISSQGLHKYYRK
jgi:hypothetical protein